MQTPGWPACCQKRRLLKISIYYRLGVYTTFQYVVSVGSGNNINKQPKRVYLVLYEQYKQIQRPFIRNQLTDEGPLLQRRICFYLLGSE